MHATFVCTHNADLHDDDGSSSDSGSGDEPKTAAEAALDGLLAELDRIPLEMRLLQVRACFACSLLPVLLESLQPACCR